MIHNLQNRIMIKKYLFHVTNGMSPIFSKYCTAACILFLIPFSTIPCISASLPNNDNTTIVLRPKKKLILHNKTQIDRNVLQAKSADSGTPVDNTNTAVALE
jgi:hypothetical protein